MDLLAVEVTHDFCPLVVATASLEFYLIDFGVLTAGTLLASEPHLRQMYCLFRFAFIIHLFEIWRLVSIVVRIPRTAENSGSSEAHLRQHPVSCLFRFDFIIHRLKIWLLVSIVVHILRTAECLVETFPDKRK